mgnify:CR=1 FL=1
MKYMLLTYGPVEVWDTESFTEEGREQMRQMIDFMHELNDDLTFEKDALIARCRELKGRSEYPLKAIIVCTPANPSGKVMSQSELEAVARAASELDLMVVSDEVYEHMVFDGGQHQSAQGDLLWPQQHQPVAVLAEQGARIAELLDGGVHRCASVALGPFC